MELPSTYELHYMSERGQEFEVPFSDKELKWQQIRCIITEMQQATYDHQFSVSYLFPEELLKNKKVLKSVANFFRDQKYNVDHDVKSYDEGKCLRISWSNEFYRYNE